MDYIKDRLKEASTWFGLISALAGLIMVFTPDYIDDLIEKALPYINQLVGLIISTWGVKKMATPDKR